MKLRSLVDPFHDVRTNLKGAQENIDRVNAGLTEAVGFVNQPTPAPESFTMNGEKPTGIYAGDKGYAIAHMPPGRHQDSSGLEWGLSRIVGDQRFIVAWFETEEMAEEFRAWLIGIRLRVDRCERIWQILRKATEE